MLNQFFLHSTRHRLCCTVILFMAFSCFGLTPSVKAQDAASDPVVTVEVASTTVWRDAVKTGSVGINCTDKAGNPVPNASVSISISSPGSVTSTSATTDSKGNVSVTVKSTDLSTDNANATVTATSQGASGTGAVTFNGALEIKKGNTDVTKGSTQSNVGEQQGLTVTTRSGTAITSSTWKVSGATPIKNWVKSDPNKPLASLTTYLATTDLNQASLTFFVTTTGAASVTVSASDAGGSGTASTSFNVSEPSFTFTASQSAPVAGTDILSLGSDTAYGITNGTLGISFTGSGGSGGTLSFAQLLNVVTISISYSNGTTQPLNPVVPKGQDGLDKQYPYPNNPSAGATNDNPNSNKQDITTTDIKYSNFAATMYLLWTSNRTGAIAIPVMSIPWSWNAEATFNPKNGNGLLKTGSSGSTNRTGTPVPAGTGVLSWSRTWNAGH